MPGINAKKREYLTPAARAKLAAAGRKGGKNKIGTKSKHVIDREKTLELAKDIIAGRTRKLIDTQSLLAFGTIKIFRIDYYYEGKKKIAKTPKLVDRDEEIIKVLDYEYGDGESPHSDTEFYFVTTKDPENQAINALLDRTYGKSTEKSEVKTDLNVRVTAINILAPGTSRPVIKVPEEK